MKNIFFILLLFISANSFAHYIWLETSPNGKLGEKHEVKVRFGEYTYGVLEEVEGEAFQGVKDFELWMVAPNGEKQRLNVSVEDNYYLASFIPSEKGSYTLALDNKDMKVLDYTQYDFGIFKPQYHAKARVAVGEKSEEIKKTNLDGIEIVELSKEHNSKNAEVSLQVFYKGKPLAENEVSIYVADLWSKKMTTDEHGKVSFQLPWDTLYTVETTFNEKVPGTFKGKDYEFIWHCATYAIQLKK
ncbi:MULTISPECIES: DUF4198 domain-containing protein [Mesonia]|uniref:Uncharacterized protein n=1 Tax=Mesonia oceanica TaxID=2687242 RepID=A0AC61YA02_9FLAO|nr:MULTISPECIES: DUF4198 domain-containing protein [Mesonia]MAN26667.1 ferredoxin [Mesonia sp.]MAQ40056.1 ferredoxin [Mesonia sp.]MBJ96642.1 ferredoxin [Flavobacteriaceae bacterium]VVV01336.1 hypothetical protein FVB9532_02626 [Mesonia oceanica]|tara:strand:- start:9062 stop:9793 length:732 start_codon:yes stop_codon:yes gene_type:complete